MTKITEHKITTTSKTDLSFLVVKWSRKFQQGLEQATTIDEILTAKSAADQAVRIRSFAVEILLSELSKSKRFAFVRELAALIAEAGIEHRCELLLRHAVEKIQAEWDGLEHSLSWHICTPEEEFDFYRWKYERSLILLEVPKDVILEAKKEEKVLIEELITSSKSKSQREALLQLAESCKATEIFEGKIGDMELRRAAWIVGPSGSGKTWVVRQFAKSMGLPVYQATVAAWSPRNSKSEHSTIQKILSLLENGPITILIDEICKIRMNTENQNSNWFRGVQDEIMALSTGSLQDFNPLKRAIENLGKSWIFYCGAFQDLYRKKVGKDIMLAEQVEDLTLSYEEIAESGWLPDELLNRMGDFIEVRPPRVIELSQAMQRIEVEAGVSVAEKAREASAHEAVVRMQGFRGLEAYTRKCAKLGVADAMRKKKAQEGELSAKNSDWI